MAPETPAAPLRGEEPARKHTINDIARLANVSKKTVSRVINESPFVREDTRTRIAEIMQRVGYTPDPQARGLAFRRSFLIGLVALSAYPADPETALGTEWLRAPLVGLAVAFNGELPALVVAANQDEWRCAARAIGVTICRPAITA